MVTVQHTAQFAIFAPHPGVVGCITVVNKAENGLAPGTADAPKTPVGAGPPHIATVAGLARTAAVIPPEFVLQFETAWALHYKTPTTDELDDYFGDLKGIISDIERSILTQLTDRVVEHESLLLAVGERLSQLDVLAAFAEVAADHRYTRPRVVEDNVFFVKGARHPLAELTVETYVPNDVALAPGKPRCGAIAIITAPNSSGKSIYLKSVGAFECATYYFTLHGC